MGNKIERSNFSPNRLSPDAEFIPFRISDMLTSMSIIREQAARLEQTKKELEVITSKIVEAELDIAPEIARIIPEGITEIDPVKAEQIDSARLAVTDAIENAKPRA